MCTICFEDWTKTNRLKVTCPFCDFESCKTCTQTYILSSSQEPHCMSCKHELNRAFIDTFCTKRFRNKEFREHWETILFDREQARMPETQAFVTRELDIGNLRITYTYLLHISRQLDHFPERCRTHLSAILYEQVTNILDTIDALREGGRTAPVVELTARCPSGECRGFVRDDWVCGICHVAYCQECHGVLGDQGHTCDPDTVKTVKLLRRDTKPCPTCHTPIHKIEGCSQMWCTQCHTAFDWRTGHVETGRIHNPHYFEFKQRSREHGDIPCGGRPTFRELRAAGASDKVLGVYLEMHRMDLELTYKYAYLYDDNLHLRVNYMLKKLTEDAFKRELQRRDKHNAKMRDIRDIYGMFTDSIGDLLRQYVLDPTRETAILGEAGALVYYTNRVIEDIQRRYVSRVPHRIILDTTT